MDLERNFWIIGGDLRQVQLASLLENDGHVVHTLALEKSSLERKQSEFPFEGKNAHCVLLPLPVTRLESGMLNAPLSEREYALEDILDALKAGQVVCGGMLSPSFLKMARERKLHVFDYYAREECQIANAVPTAEGAIQVALENMAITLHGARALVIGFGRVGKAVAYRLKGLGARVTAASRKCEDWAWAQAYGYETEDSRSLEYWLFGYDLIINMVPAMILDRKHLEAVQPDAFIIDLATLPGGVDWDAAKDLGVHAVSLPGIPGKTAPKTAAKAILNAVYNILHELGV